MSQERTVCDRCREIINTDVGFRIESHAGAAAGDRNKAPIKVDLCGSCHDRITELVLVLCSRPGAWVQIPETEEM